MIWGLDFESFMKYNVSSYSLKSQHMECFIPCLSSFTNPCTHMCINTHKCTHTHTHTYRHALISKTLANCWLQIHSWSLYKFLDTLIKKFFACINAEKIHINLIDIACNNTTDTVIGKRICCFCSLWDVSVIFIFLLYRIPCDSVFLWQLSLTMATNMKEI